MAPIHLVFPLTALNINPLGRDELRRKGTTSEEAHCRVEAPWKGRSRTSCKNVSFPSFATMPETVFQVDQREGDLIVTSGEFYAVYFKPVGQPQLILRRRTPTDDHELLAQAWQAANKKARELGWIV